MEEVWLSAHGEAEYVQGWPEPLSVRLNNMARLRLTLRACTTPGPGFQSLLNYVSDKSNDILLSQETHTQIILGWKEAVVLKP